MEKEARQTKKIKVLLVEDEAVTALALNMSLENLGFLTCPAAATGQRALESMREEKPDIVLMDINLTGNMNGVDTARKMQESGRMPVIFITGYSSGDLYEQARHLNPIAIFTKPIRLQALQKAIEAAVKA
ncbi:MAG: response regulator [Syntrophotaleaceae bacterium]